MRIRALCVVWLPLLCLSSCLASKPIEGRGSQPAAPAIEDEGWPWSPWREHLPPGDYDLPRLLESLEAYANSLVYPGGIFAVSDGGRRRSYSTFEPSAAASRHEVIDAQPFASFNDIVNVGNLAQPIVAVAALVLSEHGYFSLADPLSMYFPELESPSVKVAAGCGVNALRPASRRILVRDLFTGTAGLPSLDRLRLSGDDSDITDLRSAVLRLAEEPLTFDPGTAVDVDAALDMLGALMEQVTGSSLQAVLSATILEPLGMTDTAFYVPPEKQDRLAGNILRGTRAGSTIYLEYDFRVHGMPSAVPTSVPDLCRARSGLFSTAEDYLAFCEMLANDGMYGGRKILGSGVLGILDELGILYAFRLGRELAVSSLCGGRSATELCAAYGFLKKGSASGFVIDAESKAAALLLWPAPAPHFEYVRELMVRAGALLATGSTIERQ